MGKKIKFMGTSHRHQLIAGDDFGGRIATPISETIEFNRDNRWMIDSDDAGLSEEAVDVLLSAPEFKDVTDMERIPLNGHQQTFLGMTGDYEPEVLDEEAQAEVSGGESTDDSGSTDDPPAPAGAGNEAGTTTTTGGSTSGTSGGSTRGSGRPKST